MTQAAAQWLELYVDAKVNDPDALPIWRLPSWLAWVPVLGRPEKAFRDGSILRWSEPAGRWVHYATKEELKWAIKQGRA